MKKYLHNRIWWHRIRGHKLEDSYTLLVPGKKVLCHTCKTGWSLTFI